MNYSGGQYRHEQHHTNPDRHFLASSNVIVTRCPSHAKRYQGDDSDNENN